jgi:hypothetical protein
MIDCKSGFYFHNSKSQVYKPEKKKPGATIEWRYSVNINIKMANGLQRRAYMLNILMPATRRLSKVQCGD